MGFYFIYNDLNSKEDLEIEVEEIPTLPSFEAGDDMIVLNVAYSIINGDYSKYLRLKNLDKDGKLVLSNFSEYYFNVKNIVVKEIECNKSYVVAQIVFQIEENLYVISADNPIKLTTDSSIYNPYLKESKPTIKVWGNNDGVLMVNNQVILIRNIEEYIIIDSYLEDSYTSTGFGNNQIDGEFPILKVGENKISFSGGIKSLEIIPRWVS